MERVKSILLTLLFFIVFSVLGIAVGFGVGHVVVILDNEGLFSSWKLLDGSLKFEQIIDATSQTVWAKTNDGKLYSWKFNCLNCNRWIETQDVPTDLYDSGERSMIKDITCETDSYKFFRQPPGHLVECARGWFAGPEFGTVVYYALLEDGKIWTWQHTSSMVFDIIVPISFSFGGLILGIIAFMVFVIRRRMKNRTEAITESNL